ncbi:hypothetical protein HK100_010434, partial [Physocladia obscura]
MELQSSQAAEVPMALVAQQSMFEYADPFQFVDDCESEIANCGTPSPTHSSSCNNSNNAAQDFLFEDMFPLDFAEFGLMTTALGNTAETPEPNEDTDTIHSASATASIENANADANSAKRARAIASASLRSRKGSRKIRKIYKQKPPKPRAEFKCSVDSCGQFLATSSHLARHMRTHTGLKPYQCIIDGCCRRFARQDNMNQHAKTHTSPRKRNYVAPQHEDAWEYTGSLYQDRQAAVGFWKEARQNFVP